MTQRTICPGCGMPETPSYMETDPRFMRTVSEMACTCETFSPGRGGHPAWLDDVPRISPDLTPVDGIRHDV